MEILACPLCKGDLVLNVQSKEEDEIITGTLYCEKCNEYYPIDDGIPNMLPPQLRK
nr:methytransferase partner Trm112 [Methanomethylovorans sp.]